MGITNEDLVCVLWYYYALLSGKSRGLTAHWRSLRWISERACLTIDKKIPWICRSSHPIHYIWWEKSLYNDFFSGDLHNDIRSNQLNYVSLFHEFEQFLTRNYNGIKESSWRSLAAIWNSCMHGVSQTPKCSYFVNVTEKTQTCGRTLGLYKFISSLFKQDMIQDLFGLHWDTIH